MFTNGTNHSGFLERLAYPKPDTSKIPHSGARRHLARATDGPMPAGHEPSAAPYLPHCG